LLAAKKYASKIAKFSFQRKQTLTNEITLRSKFRLTMKLKSWLIAVACNELAGHTLAVSAHKLFQRIVITITVLWQFGAYFTGLGINPLTSHFTVERVQSCKTVELYGPVSRHHARKMTSSRFTENVFML